MKIVLVGGGSGGHITPLLAVAHELKRQSPDISLVYIGEKSGKFVGALDDSGLFDASYRISSGKFRRYPGSKLSRVLDLPTNLRNVRDAGRFAKGLAEARKLLKSIKPDGVFIKGGSVGVPVGKAAAALGIPYITHDSDTTPGLTNRMLAKKAALHATGMPAELYDYPKDKTVFTGTPVAAEYRPLTQELKDRYRSELGVDDFREIITVTGGSQGAQAINEAVFNIVPRLFEEFPNAAVLHITGPAFESSFSDRYHQILPETSHAHVIVKGHVPDLYRYMGSADVVITRASATTLNELAVQSQAVIAIPGLLADDHQTKNAVRLAKESAIVSLADADITADPSKLLAAVTDLLNDAGKRAELGRNLSKMAKPDASSDLARLLIATFSGKR